MYIVTKTDCRNDESLTIYVNWGTESLLRTRTYLKDYVSDFIKIKNSIDDKYILDWKYNTDFTKIILFRNIEEIEKGYIYNSKCIKSIDEYRFEMTYLPKFEEHRQSYNIRLISRSNIFSNDNLNKGIKQNDISRNGPDKTIHDQLILELKEAFIKRNINL